MLSEEQTVGLLKAWDELDAATQRVEMALPKQMSKAVEIMSGARIDFRQQLQAAMRTVVRARPMPVDRNSPEWQEHLRQEQASIKPSPFDNLSRHMANPAPKPDSEPPCACQWGVGLLGVALCGKHAELRDRAVMRERLACAKICDDFDGIDMTGGDVARLLSERIRARAIDGGAE